VTTNVDLPTTRQLLELGVLPFCFYQDGDVELGVFPEGEKISVGDPRPDTSGIGVRSLRASRLQGVGTRHSQVGQSSRPAVPDDAAVVENVLKLGGGGGALPGCQVCLSSYVRRIETGNIVDEQNFLELTEFGGLQSIQAFKA
jgi:hypothetical protein